MDINTAKEIIKLASLADDTVLIEGVHGIGKSQIVRQFAKENDFHIEELFLSNQEVGDLIGIPFLERDTTKWSTPIWLKRMWEAHKKGKHCVLFLDELNRAPIDVRQSALQLVLERKIHEHELPFLHGKRTMVVAAINPADEYQVDELDSALLDRFLYVSVDVDENSWLKWARENNINTVITDFISVNPDRLHCTPADGSTGTTPRSWAKISEFIEHLKDYSDDIIFQVFKGRLGAEIGAQFFSFFKSYVDIIAADEIVDIIIDNFNEYDTIEEVAKIVSEKISNVEPIRKMELANQLVNKNLIPLLVFLYSLEIEICVSFLKSFKNDNIDFYRKLAILDDELNNKQLFKRIVAASNEV